MVSTIAVVTLLAGCTAAISGAPSVSGPDSTDQANAGAAPSPSSEVAPNGATGPKAPASKRPSSSLLIAAALQAGEIDEATALVYGVWAQFGDARLPDRFVGARQVIDRGSLLRAQRSFDELSDEMTARIAPYFARPTDPASAFSGDGPPGLRASAGAVRAGPAIQSRSAMQAGSAAQRCTAGWATEPVAGVPFRVWACNNAGDRQAEAAIDAVSAILAEHAPAMMAPAPNGMGRPLPDDPKADPARIADDAIDLYVLPRGWLAPERTGLSNSVTDAAAVTFAAYPLVDGGMSGYVLIGASAIDDPAWLERVVVHEVFHVLQQANQALLASAWFDEASAVWAETYYVPEQSGAVHAAYLSDLQDSELSLHAEPEGGSNNHAYAAYLWPLFMQQEAGAASIFETWAALGAASWDGGPDEVIKAIDAQLDVADSFPEFVMRLFNGTPPGEPIQPRFVDLDPHFPDGEVPHGSGATLNEEPIAIDVAGIPTLGYRYIQVEVPGSADEPVYVTVSGESAAQAAHPPTVEALVRDEEGKYRRTQIDLTETGFCVAGVFVLVVSNPATSIRHQADATEGSLVIEREDGGCRGLVGEIAFSLTGSYYLDGMLGYTAERGGVSISGVATIRLGRPVVMGADEGRLDGPTSVYPDAGSTATASGTYEMERCLGKRSDPCVGAQVTSETFDARGDGSLEATIEIRDGQPVLTATIPLSSRVRGVSPDGKGSVRSTTFDTDAVPGGRQAGIELGCGGDGTTLFSPTAPSYHEGVTLDRFRGASVAGPLVGSWNKGHDGVTFRCTTTWPLSGGFGGSAGTATLTISGVLTQR